MSRVIEAVEWNESAEQLYERYKAEQQDVAKRKRLMALWLVRCGENVGDAAQMAGVGRRTLTRWLGWYREGGLKEVLKRVPGHGAPGSRARLSDEQIDRLMEQASLGKFRTYEEARRWVQKEYGIEYRYKGIYAVLARRGVHPKVPRPTAAEADKDEQEAWKKGGLQKPFQTLG